MARALQQLSRQRPTLPGGCPPSTIGAGGLNFRVRDGNGCGPTAMVTGNPALFIRLPEGSHLLERSIASTSYFVLQALGRLVPVGTRITAITPPAYQPGDLPGASPGRT